MIIILKKNTIIIQFTAFIYQFNLHADFVTSNAKLGGQSFLLIYLKRNPEVNIT